MNNTYTIESNLTKALERFSEILTKVTEPIKDSKAKSFSTGLETLIEPLSFLGDNVGVTATSEPITNFADFLHYNVSAEEKAISNVSTEIDPIGETIESVAKDNKFLKITHRLNIFKDSTKNIACKFRKRVFDFSTKHSINKPIKYCLLLLRWLFLSINFQWGYILLSEIIMWL